jgi:biopolymer transport protein ExbD
MAFDLEPPPVRPHEDETRLDMNALIDVCLVLLIFFILTTSYAALQKMLDLPGMTGEDQKGPVRITAEKVDKFMIRVKVRMDKPAGNSEEEPVAVIEVEGKPVEREALVPILARYVRDSRKTELLLDHSRAVPHGIVVAIQDAARGAGVERVHILVPEKELKR